MAHVLHFDEQNRKVKDANMQDEDTFEIHDPRNPVNKRRREESKKLMKEKKARRWDCSYTQTARLEWLLPLQMMPRKRINTSSGEELY